MSSPVFDFFRRQETSRRPASNYSINPPAGAPSGGIGCSWRPLRARRGLC
jgi:hypothetical protein